MTRILKGRRLRQRETKTCFLLAWYDPVDPSAPLRPFYPDLCPRTLADAIELARLVNEAVAVEPSLHEVLGIFSPSPSQSV
jgi:hypothetical protein